MHLLVLNSKFDMGGAERVTLDLVNSIDKRECDVVFCSLYEPGNLEHAIRECGYPLYTRLMCNKMDVRGLFRLRKIVCAHRIDLIYLAVQPLTLFWGVLFSKLFRVPIAALVSNDVVVKEQLKLRSYRWLMPMVDRIVTVANSQKERLVAEIGVDSDLVSVVHNGIDMRRFAECRNDAECRRAAGLRSDTRVVGIVARLVHLKAVDVLLQAARIITDTRSNVEFAIVGSGPEGETLQTQVRALGIEKHVRFVGFVQEPASIIPCFNIAVLCSRTEALPMSVLEYMAAGKPCVVSDVGGLRELVNDGENGFVVEPGNPSALAKKIMDLLDDPLLARRMGDKGRELAMRGFTIDSMARKTTSLFHQVLHES